MVESNVSAELIEARIKQLMRVIDDIETTRASLSQRLNNAGQQWRDKNYQALNTILKNCDDQYDQLTQKFEDTINGLKKIHNAIRAYEMGNLVGSGGSIAGAVPKLSEAKNVFEDNKETSETNSLSADETEVGNPVVEKKPPQKVRLNLRSKQTEGYSEVEKKPLPKLHLNIRSKQTDRNSLVNDRAEGGNSLVGADGLADDAETRVGASSAVSDIIPVVTQAKHKPYVDDDMVIKNEIISDVKQGGDVDISIEEAGKIYASLIAYTGPFHREIRHSYTQPDPDPEYVEKREKIDWYIHNAPKWEGKIFRGIGVSKVKADEIIYSSS